MSLVNFTEKDPNTIINTQNITTHKKEGGPDLMFGFDMSGKSPSVSEEVAVEALDATIQLAVNRFDSGDGITLVYNVTPVDEAQYVATGGEKVIELVTDIDAGDLIFVVKNGTDELVENVDFTRNIIDNELNLTVGLREDETIDVSIYPYVEFIEDQFVAVGAEVDVPLTTDILESDELIVVKNGMSDLVEGDDYTRDATLNKITLDVALVAAETIDITVRRNYFSEPQFVAVGGEAEITVGVDFTDEDTVVVTKNETTALESGADYLIDFEAGTITLNTRLLKDETIDVVVTPALITEALFTAVGGETEVELATNIDNSDVLTVVRDELDGDLDYLVEGVDYTRDIDTDSILLTRELLEGETIQVTVQRANYSDAQFVAEGGERIVDITINLNMDDFIVVNKNNGTYLVEGVDYTVDHDDYFITLTDELLNGETVDISIWQNKINETQYVATGGEKEVTIASDLFAGYCITTVIKNGTTTLVKNTDYTENLEDGKIELTVDLMEGETIDTNISYPEIPVTEGVGLSNFTRTVPDTINLPSIPFDGYFDVTVTPEDNFNEAFFIVMHFDSGSYIRYQYDDEVQRDSDFDELSAAITSVETDVIPIPAP